MQRRYHLVTQDKVKQSTQRGSLGLESLVGFNKALPGKWLWRLVGKQGSLQRRTVEARYGLEGWGWFSESPEDPYSVGSWKKICVGKGDFEDHIRCGSVQGKEWDFGRMNWWRLAYYLINFPTLLLLLEVMKAIGRQSWVRSIGNEVWYVNLISNLKDQKITEYMKLMEANHWLNQIVWK